jgi:hypothetical protein
LTPEKITFCFCKAFSLTFSSISDTKEHFWHLFLTRRQLGFWHCFVLARLVNTV